MSPVRASGRIYFGGSGENRTPVHSAFTWKELQQYSNYTTSLFIGQPRSDPPPHLMNVETNKKTKETPRPQRLYQWQNCGRLP